MAQEHTVYALDTSIFSSMHKAQALANTLERNLHDRNMGAASIRPSVVKIFSEMVYNAAEHGMSEAAAHPHVRFMPHRRGMAYDAVIVDHGPGIRATLARNPNLPETQSDQDAIAVAVQYLVSGTDEPTRGIGLWMTVNEMKRSGRKLWLHSGSGLFTMYGASEPELREINHRQGAVVRLTIPA